MKAIVYHSYGSPDVLQFEEVEKPAPRDDEVLIKVSAASVNAADWHLLRADPFLARLYNGLLKPKRTILGSDVAGRVEAVGSNVKQFQPGDEVFGNLFESGWGGFAEYVCAREGSWVLKPASVTFEEAAAVPLAGVTALQGLRDKGQIKPGQKVLINGAGGGVGTFAVQIAKAFGTQVTGVCSTKLDSPCQFQRIPEKNGRNHETPVPGHGAAVGHGNDPGRVHADRKRLRGPVHCALPLCSTRPAPVGAIARFVAIAG